MFDKKCVRSNEQCPECGSDLLLVVGGKLACANYDCDYEAYSYEFYIEEKSRQKEGKKKEF